MASSVGNAVAFLTKLVKRPWTITGPTASPEFLESLLPAGSYRIIAPASQTVRAIIPHAETDKVYNIAFASRDGRRSDVHITKAYVDKFSETKEADTAVTETPSTESALPPTPGGYYVMGSEYHINNTPGDGYAR